MNAKTQKTIKTLMIASMIGVTVLSFNSIVYAEEQLDDKNPRDKTFERAQEKEERRLNLDKVNTLTIEEKELKKEIESDIDADEKEKINTRIDEIKRELVKIDRKNHEKDIPETQLEILVNQKNSFEEALLNSDIVEFIPGIGIDITSKEIQIGLNQDIVNSENIDSIVEDLEKLSPDNAKWHVVYSDTANSLSCTQRECDPIVGGNYIRVDGGASCSYGFQAKKGAIWGWVTAGHCADGRIHSIVRDASGDIIGVVNAEKYDWGTYCDCAWITVIPRTLVDNKILGGGLHTITKTTPASSQQNDQILISGAESGVHQGAVSAIHVTVLSLAEGYYVQDLVRSDAYAEHGDSGGTVVEFSDQSDLYGILTAHDWWGTYHTAIDRITADMRVTPVLN